MSQTGGEPSDRLGRNGEPRPLSECIETVDATEGHARVADFLQSQPFPHYEQDPEKRRGMLVRIDADGRRTVGRFVDRQFRPLTSKTKK